MIVLEQPVAAPPIAPAAIEAELADIWRRNFSPRGLDADSHLLRSSIGIRRLARFLKEAEATLGYRIPPSAVLQLGMIRPVAAAIQSGVWPAPSPLVLIRDGRTDAAVYFVSCGDGIILNLCDVATLVDFPGQVWGLQLPGLDGEAEPLVSIPDMARHYVDALLERATPPVHHVLGYSFGGLVAVEMARILQARGRQVGLVGLLDTGCCEKFWPRSQWLLFAARKVARRILEVRAMSARAAVAHLAGKMFAALRLLRRRVKPTAGPASPSRSIYYVGGLEANFQRVRDASILAFESHNPRPIGCKLVLFKSALGDARACDPVGIWKSLTPDLEVVAVQGSHTSMIRKPFAQSVAGEISRWLARFPIPA